MYQKTILPNGLPVLTVPLPHARSVTVAFFLGAGSRYEPLEEAGISHFAEHLCFKGTHKRPLPQNISESIERVGGYMNASTDQEMTVYWVKVAKPHFPVALDLLADMLRNSLYDPQEMEKERRVILEELNSINDSPQQRIEVLIDEVLWPDQPLGRDVGGTKESVSSITRATLLDYVGGQYAPNNAVVSVAGDLRHEEVVAAIERELHGWTVTSPRTWFPSVNGRVGPAVALEARKTQQAHFCLALPGLSSLHPDRYALDMLNVVLGDGMSSRLFLEIRERRGLAYDVHSSVSHFLDDGAITVYAGVDPKSIYAAIESVLAEIDRLKESIPEEELHKAKEMTKGRLLLRTEDSRSMAGWVGAQELLTQRVNTLDQVVEIIDALTPETLQRVAREVLATERLSLAVVGPFRSQARFERLLKL